MLLFLTILLVFAEFVLIVKMIDLHKQVCIINKNLNESINNLHKDLIDLVIELREVNKKLKEQKVKSFESYEMGQFIGKLLLRLILLRNMSIIGLIYLTFKNSGRLNETFKQYQRQKMQSYSN